MATLFPLVCGLLHHDSALCHTAEIVQEWFEEQDKVFKVLTWPSDSQDINTVQYL